MKIKYFIIQVCLFMSIFYVTQQIVNHFLGSFTVNQKLVSGQNFTATELQVLEKPLLTTITCDAFCVRDAQEKEEVITPLGSYVFSSEGAVLESMRMNLAENNKKIQMFSCHPNNFFVAFEQVSPVAYALKQRYEHNAISATVLVYEASISGKASIEKTFTIHHEMYRIDVKVALKGAHIEGYDTARIFFESPSLLPMDYSSSTLGITNTSSSRETLGLRTFSIKKQIKDFIYEPKVFGIENTFLLCAYVPIRDKVVRGYYKELDESLYQSIIESQSFASKATQEWSFYCGPKNTNDLKSVYAGLEQSIQYGWFSWLAKPMLSILYVLRQHVGNFGWAIILITLFLNIFLLPLKLYAEKGMKKNSEFQKKLNYIRQRYKHDPALLEAEQAELIKKYGMPGLISLLPMLLNIPVIISLSKVLSSSIVLYGAHFLWIPDLSAKDPYYIIGILIGISMLLLSLLKQPGESASAYGKALIFGVFTMYLSSGLALFILVNNLCEVVVAWLMQRFKYSIE